MKAALRNSTTGCVSVSLFLWRCGGGERRQLGSCAVVCVFVCAWKCPFYMVFLRFELRANVQTKAGRVGRVQIALSFAVNLLRRNLTCATLGPRSLSTLFYLGQ